MPLLRNHLARSFCVVVCSAIVIAGSQLAVSQDSNPPISEPQAKRAVEVLKQDPNLAEEQKVKSLRWVDKKEKQTAKTKTPGWMRWLRDLFGWLSHTSRFLLWTGIAVLVGIVVVFLIRVIGRYQGSPVVSAAHLPTHVRELDIRPESLPDDIGTAVWQLWQSNEHRAALALLYRGLLSRLVHQHSVPIKDSSTEAQCLELARSCLQSEQSDYVSRTLRVWQFAVYGAQLPASDQVQQLCEQFAAALNKPRDRMEHLR